MRYSRKRKPRVVWLPPDPYHRLGFDTQTPIASADQTSIGEYVLTTATAGTGNFSGAVVPLIGDRPGTENLIIGVAGSGGAGAQTPATFSDLFNSGYRLRRICGHLFAYCQVDPNYGANGTYNWAVTAALQVMEAERGAALDATEGAPDIYQTSENPWIWRRTWILSQYGPNDPRPWGVLSNVQGAASLREGSVVDQKTIRKVGPDHRLFLCLQATNLDGGAGDVISSTIRFYWNLRVLGTLMNNLGNRGNSTR